MLINNNNKIYIFALTIKDLQLNVNIMLSQYYFPVGSIYSIYNNSLKINVYYQNMFKNEKCNTKYKYYINKCIINENLENTDLNYNLLHNFIYVNDTPYFEYNPDDNNLYIYRNFMIVSL